MIFEEALTALKAGERVYRAGWNGKNMWLVLHRSYPEGVEINERMSEILRLPIGEKCRFLPYIMMKTADNCYVPWLASQTDILAEDWRKIV